MRMKSLSLLPLVAAAAALTVSPRHARASEPGFALDRFSAAEAGSSWLQADSLTFGDAKLRRVAPEKILETLVLRLGVNYARDPLAVQADGNVIITRVVGDQATANLGASLTPFAGLRVSVAVPVQVYASGVQSVDQYYAYAPPSSSVAPGDLRIGAHYKFIDSDALRVAVGARGFLPTGDADAYAGGRGLRVEPQALLAGNLGSFAWAASVGALWRHLDSKSFGGVAMGHEVNGTFAAGYSALEGKLVIGPELRVALPVSTDVMNTRAGTLMPMVGAHYKFVDGWRAHLGGGVGIGDGLGTPLWNAVAAVEWVPFAHRDVEVVVAVTPPAHPDTDGDGIEDGADACASVAGVASDDATKNGCPVPPPAAPVDTDGDGIPDASDACADVAGVASDDVTKNGCPVPSPAASVDTDGDGIFDASDACPKEAGPVSADAAFTGCPAVVITDVKFKVSTSVFLDESLPSLEALRTGLARLPATYRFRVEGHSDTSGDAKENLVLSGQRAAAVVRYLVGKGFAAKRFDSEGLGSTKPRVENDTKENRALNRRVEVHILDGLEH